jgi:hypothetical protein
MNGNGILPSLVDHRCSTVWLRFCWIISSSLAIWSYQKIKNFDWLRVLALNVFI